MEIFYAYKYELNSSIILKKEGSGLSLVGISLNGVFFHKYWLVSPQNNKCKLLMDVFLRTSDVSKCETNSGI